ncbi:pentatricopeptide repeat-containing protein [Tanacetum coccineum]
MKAPIKGFKLSSLISSTISYRHHINPKPISRFFSSQYNNRSNDGGRPPSRRRSGDHSTPPASSSSRLSGYIDDDHEPRNRGRPNFNSNRNPSFSNDNSRYRVNDREVRKPDSRKPDKTQSFTPFDDNEEKERKPEFLNARKVNENKVKDVDGFLDRFKLGYDQEKDNNNSNRGDELESEREQVQAPPEDADEIFRKMKETGLIPNAVSMLHGLCSDGLVHDAMKLFGEMRERGSIPEVVIYTAVVEGFCKSGKLDEAVRIFRKMEKNGIVPNAFSYGVIVQGLCKGGRLDDAFEFCLEMVEAGHSPNLGTFTGLVNRFCKERGLESAKVVIGKLYEKGFGFDEKAVRDFMEKKGPFSPMVWEAILGKKGSQMF